MGADGSIIEWGDYFRFLFSLILVLGLILGLTWALRRFGLGMLAPQNRGRNRNRRLAVIETANLDARRRLVVVRRDNVEHLLLVGGPNDMVIGDSWESAPPFQTVLTAENKNTDGEGEQQP